MWRPLLALPGELLDWLILAGVVALLGRAAADGITLMPSAGFLEHGPGLVAFERGALLVGAAAVARQILGGRTLPAAPLWGLAAANGAALLSLAHTTYRYDSREGACFIIALSVLVLATLIACTSSRKIHAFVGGLVAIAAAQALVALAQYASGTQTPAYWLSRAFAETIRTRAYGTLGSPNVLAGFLVLGMAGAVVLTTVTRSWWRLLPAAALVLQLLALVVTYSRGGYVGLAVFTVVAAAAYWPIRHRAWPAFLLIVAVACASTLWLPSVGARAHAISPDQEDTGTSRLFIWHTALAVWRAHPLWGTGLGTFNDVYSAYRPAGVLETYAMIPVPGSAHNDFLQLLATTGIVGVVVLAAGVGWGLRLGWRRYRRGSVADRAWAGGWAAALAGIAAVSVVDENLFVITNVTLLVLFGAAVSAQVSLPDRRRVHLWERAYVLPLLAAAALLPPLLPAPLEATALHAQANQQVLEGQFGDAVMSFQAALVVDPLNSVVPSYFGDLLVDLYDRRLDTAMGPWSTMRARAEELYLAAMRLNPWDAYPRAELGLLKRREFDYAESAAWLRDAIRLDPYTPRYRQALGEVLLLSGDRAGAVDQLHEAVRLYPVALLTIDHHEGHSPRYAAAAADLQRAEATLKAAGGSP